MLFLSISKGKERAAQSLITENPGRRRLGLGASRTYLCLGQMKEKSPLNKLK
jgi:hypothetical protein